MAAATPVVYPAPSGATVAGGRAAPASMPAWRTALSSLTWTQIGANKIADQDPATDPAINPSYSPGSRTAPWTPSGTLLGAAGEWSGAALDTVAHRLWFFGGGHAGYKGNCGWSIDLLSDDPSWLRRGYPSGSIQRPVASVDADGANSSVLADGRPHAVHNYNLLLTLPDGDLVQMPTGYNWQGGAVGKGFRFDHSASEWDTSFSYDAPAGYGPSGCACYDPVRDRIWLFAGSQVSSFDPATGARTAHFTTNGNAVGYYSRMLYDELRDLIVVFLGSAGGGPFSGASVLFFDPDSPTAFTVAPQSSGSTLRSPGGVSRDPDRDRYLCWSSGGNLTVIEPPATSPGTNTWNVSTLVCSGTPSSPTNGVWGRFQVSQRLNCALLFNSTNERLWALAL